MEQQKQMKKISIIGHFGGNGNQLSGQIVKTEIVTKALKSEYGENNIATFDTAGGIKTLLKSKSIVNKAFEDSKNVIIFPAQNAVRVFAPLVALKKRKKPAVGVHYVVIGGWLPLFLEKHRYLKGFLKEFDGIYVETQSIKKALNQMGFENIFILPNCKELQILKEDELVYNTDEPLRLCTFSRVMKEKGIEDAVNAVKRVNEALGRTAYALDIYGNIESGQEEWFKNLKADFPDFIEYKGSVPFDESVSVIKDYYLLLFPTRFFTEGIPGTIIDAYAAGVPALCSKWENFSDLVEENKTGFGFEFLNNDDFYEMLLKLATDTSSVFSMKKNCIKKAKSYLPGLALKPLFERLY